MMTPQKLRHNRLDLELILDLVAENSTVLDLGCGTGDLLFKLLKERNVQGHGVEIFDQYIYACVDKGVPVVHADLDEGLDDYPDKSFDYVILSRTLQVVHKPHQILKEMLRVGRIGIVSLPNFGFWKVRSQLFFKGKMPVTKILPYEWYDTPNIHLVTIKDFKIFCEKENIKIKKQIYLEMDRKGKRLANLFPNLFAELAIFVIQNNH
jgi:methionine biosynthesis protein MetW